MHTEPGKEHRWLDRLVGEWMYEVEVSEPGKSPQKFRGTESVRSLGGLWILGEGKGEMPGFGTATSVLTLGYDPQKACFVGSWVGSMMATMWVYQGHLDAAERTLTLECEGPSMAGDGTIGKYRDVIRLDSDDQRTLSSHTLGADGGWHQFMTSTYRRTKSS